MIKFQEQLYFDDRLYVLYLCKATAQFNPDGHIMTTIYHEEAPSNYKWCVVTYKNCDRYPVFSIKLFDLRDEAQSYIRIIEPETPLISLNGKSPKHPVLYDDYLSWKENKSLKEYDYKAMYEPGGSNPREVFMQTFEQFLSVNPDFPLERR